MLRDPRLDLEFQIFVSKGGEGKADCFVTDTKNQILSKKELKKNIRIVTMNLRWK